jgi:hypothetical protein
MLYTPILPEAASGTLEPRYVVVPVRQMCRHSELLGRATSLDTKAQTVQVETEAGTSTSCRCCAESSGWSPTGRWRSSSGATSPSSAQSVLRGGSESPENGVKSSS